jgi:hypothetical protein
MPRDFFFQCPQLSIIEFDKNSKNKKTHKKVGYKAFDFSCSSNILLKINTSIIRTITSKLKSHEGNFCPKLEYLYQKYSPIK